MLHDSGRSRQDRDSGTRLITIDPTGDPRWDPFTQSHPAGVVFHTRAWARVLQEAYDYAPHYHALQRPDGTIQAALALMLVNSRLTGRRLVSLPFCDYAPPLISSAAEGHKLFEGVVETHQRLGSRRIEVRGWPASEAIPRCLRAVQYYYRHARAVPEDAGEILQGISKSARNHVRQAVERGVRIRTAQSVDDVRRLYELNVIIRRQHGVLPQPFAFFESIWRNFIEKGNGFILLCEVESRIIGGSLCLTHGDTVTGLFSVADPAERYYRPTHLLYSKELESASLRGYRCYDVGRSGSDETGLITFKEQWRMCRSELPYYYYPAPGGFSMTRPRGLRKHVVSTIARRAPQTLAEGIGRVLYKHLG